MASLTLDKISKIYQLRGRTALVAVDRVSMAVNDGEIVGLLGSSGCGKTSTLRMIAGFESVDDGEIRIGETVINALPPARRGVAMAFEGYALYPPLKVRDNIGFALLRGKQPPAEIAAKINEVAELLDITGVLENYPGTISAGQQQRVSLARALIRNADLHLLDEPMSQLEPQLRAVLRARIKEWLIQRQLTTVFVTHDQTEAIALADRIAVMEEGVLQQFATPAELKDRPANLFVAGFIGEPPMNLFPVAARREGDRWTIEALNDAGDIAFSVSIAPASQKKAISDELVEGRALQLGVRPHRIRLGDGAGALRGTVTSNQWLGDQTHLGLDVGGCGMTMVAHAVVAAPVGTEVEITIPLDAVHLFDTESGKALFHGSELMESHDQGHHHRVGFGNVGRQVCSL